VAREVEGEPRESGVLGTTEKELLGLNATVRSLKVTEALVLVAQWSLIYC
jgi:hypothetical protein